jgi:hypothetical protein
VAEHSTEAGHGEHAVRVKSDPITNPATALASRPTYAVGVLLALAAVVHFVPGLERLSLLVPGASEPELGTAPLQPTTLDVGESELPEETRMRPELAQPESIELPRGSKGPIALRATEADSAPINTERPPVPLKHAHKLAGFYESLLRVTRREPSAISRVLHFGDSIIVSDYVSGTLRRQLQDQFGDAGHGFMLVANAWPSYFHNDVFRYATSGWRVSRIVGPLAADGLYGLGGVSFNAQKHALARFGTAKEGKHGRAVSRFEILYLAQPGGAQVAISVDGKPHSVLDTNAPEKRALYHSIRVPDGEHEFELSVQGNGSARMFGVVLERDTPGVVLDALGIQGARIRFLDKQDDAHWAEQLRLRGPSLLVYQFGANESADGFAYPMDEYHATMKEVLIQGQRAVPEASCLVIGAMDRAAKVGDELKSIRVLPHLVREQERAAEEAGCAYFDTYQSMGGHGSMPSWVRRGLGQADFTHPTAVGAQVIGTWIYRALMQGYDEYRAAKAAQRAVPASAE